MLGNNLKHMNQTQEVVQPQDQKREYVQPELQKREQIKEVTEGAAPVVTPGSHAPAA